MGKHTKGLSICLYSNQKQEENTPSKHQMMLQDRDKDHTLSWNVRKIKYILSSNQGEGRWKLTTFLVQWWGNYTHESRASCQLHAI